MSVADVIATAAAAFAALIFLGMLLACAIPSAQHERLLSMEVAGMSIWLPLMLLMPSAAVVTALLKMPQDHSEVRGFIYVATIIVSGSQKYLARRNEEERVYATAGIILLAVVTLVFVVSQERALATRLASYLVAPPHAMPR